MAILVYLEGSVPTDAEKKTLHDLRGEDVMLCNSRWFFPGDVRASADAVYTDNKAVTDAYKAKKVTVKPLAKKTTGRAKK